MDWYKTTDTRACEFNDSGVATSVMDYRRTEGPQELIRDCCASLSTSLEPLNGFDLVRYRFHKDRE